MPTADRRAICDALIADDPDRLQLWHHSPTFRSQVTALADLADAAVDGIALQADETDRLQHERYLAAMRTPGRRLIDAPPQFDPSALDPEA